MNWRIIKLVLTGKTGVPKHRSFWSVVINVTHSKPVTLICLGDLHTPNDAGLQRRVWGHIGAKLQVWMRQNHFCHAENSSRTLGHADVYFYSVPLQHCFFSIFFRFTPTSRSKALEFHLTGECVLPHVSVLCPTMRNSAGSPMINFRRVSVGNRHTRPLVLLNNGYFPVQVSSKQISSFILCSFIMLSSKSVSLTQTPPGFRIVQFTFKHEEILHLSRKCHIAALLLTYRIHPHTISMNVCLLSSWL